MEEGISIFGSHVAPPIARSSCTRANSRFVRFALSRRSRSPPRTLLVSLGAGGAEQGTYFAPIKGCTCRGRTLTVAAHIAAPGKVGPLWLRQPSGIVSAKFRVLTYYLLDAGQSTSSKADGRTNMQTGSEQPTSKTAFFDPDRPRPTSLGGRACILEAHLISG